MSPGNLLLLLLTAVTITNRSFCLYLINSLNSSFLLLKLFNSDRKQRGRPAETTQAAAQLLNPSDDSSCNISDARALI